ncbi:MAG: radical SAM protein [Candidatus Woesearchaeota archaeon]
MDAPIESTPTPSPELQELIGRADAVYRANFDGSVWFGRCIFLSWYCERGTCTFCFRSVTKSSIENPSKARRSLASIVAEALLIKGLGWRIEFLTGGYGSCSDDDIVRYTKLVSQVIGDGMWVNLGELGVSMLEAFKPYVHGIVSSIETVEQELHNQVCPDKPIQPYIDMIDDARKMGFAQGMTIIIGLGESRDDFPLLKGFIEDNGISRITVYALRPVRHTPFEHGPSPEDVAWWVAQLRIAFPKMEIVVGSARYRIPEISLVLKAGANAITKLPGTKMFNTEDGRRVEREVKKAGRTFISTFTSSDVKAMADWEGMIRKLDLTDQERDDVRTALDNYLDAMEKRGEELFDSCEF